MTRVLIIPAAGLGSRLRSDRPKPLTLVNGRPMLDHVIERFVGRAGTVVVIAHPSFAERMRAHLAATLGENVRWRVLEQLSPTGMLDAILIGAPEVEAVSPDRVWIVWADQAALLPQTVERLAEAEAHDPTPEMVVATVRGAHPYTHLERNATGQIVRVLQRREGDPMPQDGESDAGLFSLSRTAYERLREFSDASGQGGGTGERNFLPFIPWLAARGPVATIPCTDPREAIGINTPEELANAAAWLKERAATR